MPMLFLKKRAKELVAMLIVSANAIGAQYKSSTLWRIISARDISISI